MDYVAPFEIIRNIENAKSKSKKKDEDNKIEEVKEEDEEDKGKYYLLTQYRTSKKK